MKRIAFAMVAVAALTGGIAYIAPASGEAEGEAVPDLRRSEFRPDTVTGA